MQVFCVYDKQLLKISQTWKMNSTEKPEIHSRPDYNMFRKIL